MPPRWTFLVISSGLQLSTAWCRTLTGSNSMLSRSKSDFALWNFSICIILMFSNVCDARTNHSIQCTHTICTYTAHHQVVLVATEIKAHMTRDQPNSRFHGSDIFREIGLLPWNSWNPWFIVNFKAFAFIYEGFQSLINSFCADFAVCCMSHFSTK